MLEIGWKLVKIVQNVPPPAQLQNQYRSRGVPSSLWLPNNGTKILFFQKSAFSYCFFAFFHFFRDLFAARPGPFSGNEELEAKNRWAAPPLPQLDNQTRFWGVHSSLWHPNNDFSTTHFQKHTKITILPWFYTDFGPVWHEKKMG